MNLQGSRNYDLQAAVLEAEQRFTTANPKSKANFEAACRAMPGGNTRTVLFYAPYPLTIAKGEGCYVTDIDGHTYTDFLGEYTAGLYGHSHPVIKKAIMDGLERGIVLGGHNEIEVKLATEVCRRWGMERLRFTNSGTEGNLMAINSARAFTGRNKIMVFEHGYHGGVLSARPGGSPTNAPYEMIYCKFNDTANAKKLIAEHAKDLACVIIEPMMGGAGCLPADKDFLHALSAETKKHGVMFVLDEVVTSRLAPGGAQQIYGVKPDLMSFGKYIGGGLSFGGFGGRADIMDNYDPRLGAKAWPHAGTFNQNMLTMSAGYAGISQVFTPEVCIAFNKKGEEFRARLQDIVKKRSLPITLTGMGSVTMIHFCEGPVRTPDDANKSNALARDLLHLDMLSRGVYMTRRGMVNMSLPMADKEFDKFAEAFDSFLGDRTALLAKS